MNSSRRSHPSVITPGNAEYIDQLYEAFQESPDLVSSEWRNYFYGFEDGLGEGVRSLPPVPCEYRSNVERLFMQYRLRGHAFAKLDPLEIRQQERPTELNPGYYGLGEEALEQSVSVLSVDPVSARPAREIIAILESIYCSTVASEYMHVPDAAQRRWIRQRLESTHGNWAAQHTPQERKDILHDLTAAEGLERYLHRRFTGQKRFSLEGGDSLIPLLDELVQGGGSKGITDVVIGMAHRGRLNVLVNLLGKSPQKLFSEFEHHRDIDEETGSGDVKYHQGFYSNIQTPGGPVHLSLAFNPSHLEIVGPVVEGGCRARLDQQQQRDENRVLPVLVHGDAAFIGQGVVAETFNLSKLTAYSTGGSVHVVVNNQIGFTTSQVDEARSTMYCTDVAKIINAPIFHVNSDDPDAVRFISRLALDYRQTFNADVVIDLVCYRRQGHNEADEPMMTQPNMYSRISNLETTRSLYARRLEQEGLIASGDADQMMHEYSQALEAGQVVVREFLHGSRTGYEAHWERYLKARPDEQVDTRVALDSLQRLGGRTLQVPDDFAIHRGVQRVLNQRQQMLDGNIPLDWGMAETLAYAALLEDGYAIRLSGQDSQRGTFSHRHAVLNHQHERRSYTPLANLFDKQPRFEAINSVLSELAVLAFEYGYATSSPNTLVIWEAQFGDFGNCAQVVIDQFISSGYLKWGRICPLTLFLPHGYDGQGPEHSSARLERFLQLSAELNMRVWAPTTPAQFFHLIRDQIKRSFRRPLIVMTPKSLLRHPLSKSDMTALTDGALALVIPDIDTIEADSTRRIVLCSGKVFFDLLAARRDREISDIAIIRVEQLYPFPRKTLAKALENYPNAKELIWCQEEPRNQGAWYQIRHHLRALLSADQTLGYAGRAPSASPACGYLELHQAQQQSLIDTALSTEPVDDPGERLEDTDTHYPL